MSIIESTLANGTVKVEVIEAWSGEDADHTRSDWIYTGDAIHVAIQITSSTANVWAGTITYRGFLQEEEPADSATAVTGNELLTIAAPGQRTLSLFFGGTSPIPTWFQARIRDTTVSNTCDCNIKIVRFKRTD